MVAASTGMVQGGWGETVGSVGRGGCECRFRQCVRGNRYGREGMVVAEWGAGEVVGEGWRGAGHL